MRERLEREASLLRFPPTRASRGLTARPGLCGHTVLPTPGGSRGPLLRPVAWAPPRLQERKTLQHQADHELDAGDKVLEL